METTRILSSEAGSIQTRSLLGKRRRSAEDATSDFRKRNDQHVNFAKGHIAKRQNFQRLKLLPSSLRKVLKIKSIHQIDIDQCIRDLPSPQFPSHALGLSRMRKISEQQFSHLNSLPLLSLRSTFSFTMGDESDVTHCSDESPEGLSLGVGFDWNLEIGSLINVLESQHRLHRTSLEQRGAFLTDSEDC
eukprot:TRINITY_DN4669_c0_g2_i1.p1 TRINITY_DN4669_c0_g2~~TRINITY_DN4669_c0_g2_i1.p1  ORF type:complete len:189 (+),score=27.25 TRINITY_DN4669_c0_g2_i1:138-704(+)